MENKYYKPDLIEFHYGFEFELKDSAPPEDDWKPEVFGKFHTLKDIEKWTQAGDVRVKLLDRQDIEELGWDYSETYSGNDIFKKNVSIERGEYEAILHHVQVTKWVMIYLKNKSETYTVFAGHIRNKSQLRQLMSWLNIE